MLIIGNKSNINTLGNRKNTFLYGNNIFIYGTNGSGKTTLFKKINKANIISHNNIDNNIFFLNKGFTTCFINQSNNKSRLKRYDSKILDDNSIEGMMKINFRNYSKINISEINVVNFQDWEQKFNFLPFTLDEFNKIIDNFLEAFVKIKDKNRENIMSLICLSFKTTNKLDSFLNKKEIRNLNKIVYAFSYLKSEDKNYGYILFKDKGIESFIKYAKSIYSNDWYKNLEIISNGETGKLLKISIKKKKICDYISKKIKPINSFGINKYNKLLKLIKEEILLNDCHTYILDDPFDGMSQNIIDNLVQIFSKLMTWNIKFVILTNSKYAFSKIRNESNSNNIKCSTGILKKIEDKLYIGETTNIDNILFKWNDKNYFLDLKKIIKKYYFSSSISNHLLSIHSEIISDFRYLLEISETNLSKNNLKNLYDNFSNYSKNKNPSYDLISKDIKKYDKSIISFWINNYYLVEISLLFKGHTNGLIYSVDDDLWFLIYGLAKIIFINMFDILEKELDSKFYLKDEIINKNIYFIKKVKSILKQNKSWRDYFKHRMKFPIINAIDYSLPNEEFIKLINFWMNPNFNSYLILGNANKKFEEYSY